MEVRELLDKYDFPGDDTPIIKGSALKALELQSTDLKAPEYALHLGAHGRCRHLDHRPRSATLTSRS